MAPALPPAPPSLEEPRQVPPRRRALASVDNCATLMEEDDMGLRQQPSLAKDSQEMEQIMVDLTPLAPNDLLHVIKTFEGGGDSLSTGDADVIFPGFELADADSESDAVEDAIKATQARLERRCSILKRRLRILQSRTVGKRISDEVVHTFDRCARGARKDGGGRPIGMKAFVKRVETTAALQASVVSRPGAGPNYYRARTSRVDPTKLASVGIASGTLTGLEDTAGALRSHLSVVKHDLDSDATASSSGAESNDEAVTYNNPHQQTMPIAKRALWTWQRERASIASRWGWLQAQIHELEYKIRQHSDLHAQVREAKGPVEFEGEPVAYQGCLPGANMTDDDDGLPNNDPALETCARVRPLRRETFKKRKLLQMHNLHIATTKAAKPSDIRCSCGASGAWRLSCPVCVGRAEATQPAPERCSLSRGQRVAAIDAGYHPVLSDIKDISPSLHLRAVLSQRWYQRSFLKSLRGSRHGAPSTRHMMQAPDALRTSHTSHLPEAPETSLTPHASHTSRTPLPTSVTPRLTKRHPTRLKRGRPPLSRKVKEKDDETSTSGQERSRGRPSTETRYRRQSYDIDNIVIPQSVAANTRPQILTYKEIITPKWRVLEMPETAMNNGVMKTGNCLSMESDEEDVSEAAVHARHARAEVRERNRYLRKRRSRRPQEENHEMGMLQPEVEIPLQPPPQPLYHETVRPYTPRQFPLPDEMYDDMLSSMPDGFRQASPEPTPPPTIDEDDDSSTLSPMSVTVFDCDDPDDAEWDPNSEKAERRKSSFK